MHLSQSGGYDLHPRCSQKRKTTANRILIRHCGLWRIGINTGDKHIYCTEFTKRSATKTNNFSRRREPTSAYNKKLGSPKTRYFYNISNPLTNRQHGTKHVQKIHPPGFQHNDALPPRPLQTLHPGAIQLVVSRSGLPAAGAGDSAAQRIRLCQCWVLGRVVVRGCAGEVRMLEEWGVGVWGVREGIGDLFY